MADVFSTISGQFTKPLVLGAVLPMAVFIVLWLILVAPLLPPGLPLLDPLQVFGAQWQLLTISIAAIVLGGLLYNFGSPIIRFYEGYPWQHSLLGEWRTRHYQAEWDALHARAAGLYSLLRTLSRDDDHATEIYNEWNDLTADANQLFPDQREHVLPTRLGNIIRAFERYSAVEYGIDAIILWPRMFGVLPDTYAGSLDDAKSSLSFMLNISLLSLLLAAAILVVGLANPPASLWTRVLLPAALFALLSLAFYRLSVRHASRWGDLVKGAFDLYRADLLKQLGYEQKPKSRDAERALWNEITLQMLYGDATVRPGLRLPRVRYADPSVECAVPDAKLDLTRGLLGPVKDGIVTVMLSIHNSGSVTASDVRVTDTIPDGYDYEWRSERLAVAAPVAGGAGGGLPPSVPAVSVTGTNSCTFSFRDDLPPGGEFVVAYRAVAHK